MRWQWHQLDNMQIICTSLQTDNHDSIPLSAFSALTLLVGHPTHKKLSGQIQSPQVHPFPVTNTAGHWNSVAQKLDHWPLSQIGATYFTR